VADFWGLVPTYIATTEKIHTPIFTVFFEKNHSIFMLDGFWPSVESSRLRMQMRVSGEEIRRGKHGWVVDVIVQCRI
jgi:hypothetical protein